MSASETEVVFKLLESVHIQCGNSSTEIHMNIFGTTTTALWIVIDIFEYVSYL